jgi:alanine dehydrogenase
MLTMETRLLSKSDVERCIDMRQIVEIIEEVYKAHAKKRVVMPSKITLDMAALGIPNWMNAMPAYVEQFQTYGIKWVGGFFNNQKEYNLPNLMGTLILNNPQNGYPIAILDAVYITNMRTGATAGVATRHLTRNQHPVVAFIGSGVQAWTSLQAIRLLFDVKEVRTADINPDARQKLASLAKTLKLNSRAVDNNREAVEGADIIVVATNAAEPLVMKEWVAPGAVIAKMGSYQELDDALTLGADKIIVDHRDQSEHRGELVHLFHEGKMTQKNIHAEIGEVIIGTQTGREKDDEIIVAGLVGMGSEDVAVGATVLKQAEKLNLGKTFNFLA